MGEPVPMVEGIESGVPMTRGGVATEVLVRQLSDLASEYFGLTKSERSYVRAARRLAAAERACRLAGRSNANMHGDDVTKASTRILIRVNASVVDLAQRRREFDEAAKGGDRG